MRGETLKLLIDIRNQLKKGAIVISMSGDESVKVHDGLTELLEPYENGEYVVCLGCDENYLAYTNCCKEP